MKKKVSIVILAFVIFAILVFAVDRIDTKRESSIAGNEILNKELAVKTQSIIILGFDEIEHIIDDPDEISSIIDLLVECSYRKLSEDEYIEGFYNMDILTDEDTISIGITDSYLVCAGEQYKVVSGSLADIVVKIDIELKDSDVVSLDYIDKYFINAHDHETMKDNYTVEVDLNVDGNNEKIVIENLGYNGGDGGYFPHVFNSDGTELIYQEDNEGSPFFTKWVEGSLQVFYDDMQITILDKDYIFEHYKTKEKEIGLWNNDQELEEKLAGKAVFENNMEVKEGYMANPIVKGQYQTADNPIFEVFYLENPHGVIADFSGNPPYEF